MPELSTISLISHPSKIMPPLILSRLKAKAEEQLAEEQAGCRAGRGTVEQIFNCRVITEKHQQHRRDLFRNFIVFKKASDRVFHAGLWLVLRSFNIDEVDEGQVQAIQALYENPSGAVLLQSAR